MDGHVARREEIRNAFKMLIGNLKVSYRLRDVGVDGRNILKWRLKEMGRDDVDSIELVRSVV
jgi:hypothetical protein